MAEYYLMSQLPSLDGVGENAPLPITEKDFLEVCRRFLGKNELNELEKLTLLPPRNPVKSSSPLIEAWNEGERNLRLALAKLRADKMKKSFAVAEGYLSAELLQTARTAVEFESPMEAEKFLNDYRLKFLETLRPMDTFSRDSVFYYCLKLKLISRMRNFDNEGGKTAYKNIYNSVLNGD